VPYTELEAQAALDAARGMLMPAYRGDVVRGDWIVSLATKLTDGGLQ
jgi:hypothetical protein